MTQKRQDYQTEKDALKKEIRYTIKVVAQRAASLPEDAFDVLESVEAGKFRDYQDTPEYICEQLERLRDLIDARLEGIKEADERYTALYSELFLTEKDD